MSAFPTDESVCVESKVNPVYCKTQTVTWLLWITRLINNLITVTKYNLTMICLTIVFMTRERDVWLSEGNIILMPQKKIERRKMWENYLFFLCRWIHRTLQCKFSNLQGWFVTWILLFFFFWPPSHSALCVCENLSVAVASLAHSKTSKEIRLTKNKIK